MTFRAVLFDLDGTLLDTLDDLAEAMNAALAQLGLPGHPVEAYKLFVGDGMATLARRALPADRRNDASVAQLTARMRQTYAQRWDGKTRPYEGIPAMLNALSARGVGMAVLSNKPHDFTTLCVRRLLPTWRFAAVQGVCEDVPPKPDPIGAGRVVDRIGMPAEQFLYLGDTGTDMQTAAATGMYAVGALWGFRTADELTRSGAKRLLRHPTELLGLL